MSLNKCQGAQNHRLRVVTASRPRHLLRTYNSTHKYNWAFFAKPEPQLPFPVQRYGSTPPSPSLHVIPIPLLKAQLLSYCAAAIPDTALTGTQRLPYPPVTMASGGETAKRQEEGVGEGTSNLQRHEQKECN